MPHTSAGRLPTDRGLRLFVNGLELGDLTQDERTIDGNAPPPCSARGDGRSAHRCPACRCAGSS
jgi:heat-inducible transcriptional repressor